MKPTMQHHRASNTGILEQQTTKISFVVLIHYMKEKYVYLKKTLYSSTLRFSLAVAQFCLI